LNNELSPLFISIKTSVAATIVTFILGILAAWFMTSKRRRYGSLIDALFTLPMVLPPTVLGFILLLIFGKNGPIGKLLSLIEVKIIFSWSATVIAAVVVSFPLMYNTSKGALEQIDKNILNAARTLGISEWKIFWTISLHLAWPGIAAGTVLAFARALGEFGATLMVAGSIPGKTQTIPIAIYFAVEGGDMKKALIWVAAVSALSFAVIILTNIWSSYQYKLTSMGRGSKA
jgi:molybdate transport system permease protein